jgi:hypothetical protein
LFYNGLVEKASPAIRVYKRKNADDEIVGWSAEIKIPGLEVWADVREGGMPTDYFGSIYPTKEVAIEAARQDIKLRSGYCSYAAAPGGGRRLAPQ